MKNPAENLPLIPSNLCSGDNCESVEPWPLHHIRPRNNNNNSFLRLCSSCVLKHHPGSFCSSCFELLDSPDRPPLIHCSKCSSVAHLSCLEGSSSSSLYLCPVCDSPSPTSFSYFPDRAVDLRAAKILLLAARLSAASMSRAAAIARADVEKKVKEAALARKRARDMLDRSLVVSEKRRVGNGLMPVGGVEGRKKACRPPGALVQKRVQERESEKWKRFSEPIGLVDLPGNLGGGDEKIKGCLDSDVGDGLMKDEEKKGIVSGLVVEIGKQELENGSLG